MGRAQRLVIASSLALACGVALATTDCATATEIVVEVRSEACPPGRNGKTIKATGIAVGTAKTIDDARDSAVKDGCEPGTDRVGTLTLYPSGEDDDEVTFRVVSGIDRPLDQCKAAKYDGCITQHRTMRFVPRTRQNVVVKMSLLCLGVTCPEGKTCDNGVCVESTTPPVQDGAVPDGSAPIDAGLDGSAGDADAGPVGGCDPARCKGPGVVGCDNGVCIVDCSLDGGASGCPAGVDVCPGDQDCRVVCGDNACKDLVCTTAGSCVIGCTGSATCDTVQCNAGRCDVRCTGDGACTAVTTTGGAALFDCPKKTGGAPQVCANLRCKSTSCALSCDGNGCSGAQKCCAPAAAGCTGGWDTPIPTTCP